MRLLTARFLMVVLVLFWALPAAAATVSLSLGVPKVQVGQTTRVTVTVVGEQPTTLPTIPDPEGVRVRFRERKSQFISTPGTGIVPSYQYIFDVTPSEIGSYELGPAEVVVNSGPILTETVSLAVQTRKEAVKTADLIATTQFRRQTAWEGEIVLYDATLTARVPIRDVQWRFPQFEGLQIPPNVGAQNSTTQIGDPSGDIVIVKSVIPLIAAGTGDRTQPPSVARVSQLTSRVTTYGLPLSKQRIEPGERAPLKVRPLPKSPPGFSGLVGEFSFSSVLDKTEKVKVGESVGWTVNVIGNGVVDGFELPELENLEGVRIYRDKSSVAGGMVEGEYIGRKTFSMVLVPTARGVYELPNLDVVVFSPEAGRYITKTVKLGKISVMGAGKALKVEDFGANGEEAEPATAPEVDLEGIYTGGLATTVPLAPVLPLILILVLAPGGLVLAAELGSAMNSWWAGRRTVPAQAQGRSRLASAPDDPTARLAVYDLALREVLAKRAGVSVGELRRDEVLSELPSEVAAEVQQAFRGLDRARFAGGPVPEDAVDRVRVAIDKLEAA